MHSRRFDVPPLDPLLAFEAAARTLSFTRAGAELFLTQSAVSRQIQALERDLGVSLFRRLPRALALTREGETLYRVTQAVLSQLHDTARQMRTAGHERAVTLTTTPGFAALWLIPRLAAFTRAHPGIDVRISASNDVVDLERAGIDLAIRYGPAEAAASGRPLFAETVFPVCAPSLVADPVHPLATPSDLRHHVLLYLDDTRAPSLDWGLWFHALGLTDVAVAGRLHFSHYDQVVQAAVGGQGVALGRDPLIRSLLREGKLVAPFRGDVASSRSYYVAESSAAKSLPHAQAFIGWLLAETARESPHPP